MSYVERYKPTSNEMAIIITVATILLLAIAYLILIFIDMPLRNYLSSRSTNRQQTNLTQQKETTW